MQPPDAGVRPVNPPRSPGATLRWSRWIFAAIMALGVGLRLYRLTDESLWMDEWITLAVAQLPTAELLVDRLQAGHGPVYFLLMQAWISVAGADDLTLRLPSVIASILTLPLVYHLGRRIAGPVVGLVGLTLMATSAISIEYAQEARMYSLVVLLALLAVAAGLDVVGSNGQRGLARFTLWLLLGLFTHHYFLFLAVFLLAYLVVCCRRSAGRRLTVALTILSLCYLPYLGLVVTAQLHPRGGNPELSPFNLNVGWWDVYANILVRHRVATYTPDPQRAPVIPNFFLVVLLLLPLVAWWSGRTGRRHLFPFSPPLPSATIALLYGWLTVPVLLAAAVAISRPKLFGVHHLLYVAPAAYLLAALGAVGHQLIRWRWWQLTMLAAAVTVSVAVAANLASFYRVHHKPPWREVAEHLRSAAPSQPVVVWGSAREALPVFNYYAARTVRLSPLTAATQLSPGTWLVGYGSDLKPLDQSVLAVRGLTTSAVTLIDRVAVFSLRSSSR